MKKFFEFSIFSFVVCLLIGCKTNHTTHTLQEDINITSDVIGKLSIVQMFKEKEHLPMKERIALYYQLKKESPNDYDFDNEDGLNFYGYQFLWNNRDIEAMMIFKLIVTEFPNSSNAYDSYGEICLKVGDNDQALINYRKSLELNPDNFNATDQIELILHPERKPENPSDKFLKVYKVSEYKDDLEQLAIKLTETHPNVYKFISKNDFWKILAEKKSLITEKTTYAEFIWHCDEIIASINCSHTSISGFYQESDMLPKDLRFPLMTRWVNNKLYVIDPLTNVNKVAIKDEIESINGMPVTSLIKDIYKHLPSQGYIETTKKHLFNTWSTCLIPYALNFPKSYTISIKGKETPTLLDIAKEVKNLHNDPSIKSCGKDLCLELLQNNKIAVLTIGSFNYYKFRNNFEDFKDFIDSIFVKINASGAKHLIIDVRFNGGGSQSASIHLLRYLVDKPFTYYSNAQFEGKKEKIEGETAVSPFKNRYNGKLYFLIDGIGNSTTGHFMSIAKVLKLGTIVGEELGSNQFCSAGGQTLRLSNTKIVYTVADNTHESMATSLPDETGILPDIYVTQSIEDFINRIDKVKVSTIELIEKDEK